MFIFELAKDGECQILIMKHLSILNRNFFDLTSIGDSAFNWMHGFFSGSDMPGAAMESGYVSGGCTVEWDAPGAGLTPVFSGPSRGSVTGRLLQAWLKQCYLSLELEELILDQNLPGYCQSPVAEDHNSILCELKDGSMGVFHNFMAVFTGLLNILTGKTASIAKRKISYGIFLKKTVFTMLSPVVITTRIRGPSRFN